MMIKPHDCPSCRCINHSSAQTWATERLIHTADNQDAVSASEAFSSYLSWFRQAEGTQFLYTQNKLTRWLRESGHRVELISGRNMLIGYRLNP